MTNPTSNFGWQMPTATDLVTDLPADFAVFGQAVDTSMADLKGGTTGQILAKATNTDMDFTWVTNDVGDITAVTAGTGISGGGTSGAVTITNSMATEITAKGDLIAGTGSATFDNLPVGTNGQTLVADSTASTGLKWDTPTPPALVFIKSQTFSNVANVDIDSAFTTTYTNYKVIFQNLYAATATDDLHLQWRFGATTQATGYYGTSTASSSTAVITQTANAAQLTLAAYLGSSTQYSNFDVTMMGMGVAAESLPFITGQGYAVNDTQGFVFAGTTNNTEQWTGFRLKSSSTNITGKVLIYGMVNA